MAVTDVRMVSDEELLADFAGRGAKEAFEQLVERHAGWVYAAAFRQLRDRERAEEAAQAVFVLLVQKARGGGAVAGRKVSGWLFMAVTYTVRTMKRSEWRRKVREREVARERPEALEEMPQLAEELDEAVARLGSADRAAIVLRFYQRLEFGAVAAGLGVSEVAARKRVTRAVERLRVRLAGAAGAAGTAGGAVGATEEGVMGAAAFGVPVGGAMAALGAKVAGAALAAGGGAAVAGGVGAAVKGAAWIMAMTKVKVAAAVVVVITLVGAAGVAIYIKASGQAVAPSPSVLKAELATPVAQPVPPTSAIAVGRTDESKQLILSLQRQREATAKEAPNGQGRAVVTVSRDGKTVKSKVAFRYHGDTSAAEYTADPDSNVPVRRYLWEQGKEVIYVLPGGGPPAAVAIKSHESGVELSTANEIQGWSLSDFMKIPMGAHTEELIFQALLNRPELSVSASRKAGSKMEIEVIAPQDPRKVVEEQKWVLEFDLSLGGVMTNAHKTVRGAETAKSATNIDESMQNIWRRTPAGDIVPVSRHVMLKLNVADRGQSAETQVDFEQFDATDATSDRPTFQALGVAFGTPVVDEIDHIEWRHGDFGDGLPSADVLTEAVEQGKAKAVESP